MPSSLFGQFGQESTDKIEITARVEPINIPGGPSMLSVVDANVVNYPKAVLRKNRLELIGKLR